MVGHAYCLKSLHGVRGSYAKEWTFGTFVSLKHNVKIINSLKNAWQSLISFACGNSVYHSRRSFTLFIASFRLLFMTRA